MKKEGLGFWRDWGIPFLLGFGLVSTIVLVSWPRSKTEKLPALAIILSPHFDDAALSLGGFMAENKAPVVVATFFAAEPAEPVTGGWDKISGFKNSREAIAARIKENEEALGKTKALPLNLRYIDFQYRHATSSASREETILSLEKDLDTMLDAFKNSEALSVYGPAEFGPSITHPDHQIVHDAFTATARKNHAQNIRFFFYEDFPYVAQYQKTDKMSLKEFLEQKNQGLTLITTPLPVSTSSLEKKIASIDAYASQEKAFAELGNNIKAEASDFTRTRCKANYPAWYACEVVYEILK